MTISSSSNGGAFRLRWDVFLSFRGEDTRECFTKKLYESLHREGIRAFMDDEGLDRGDNIQTSLLQAIDGSAASIVIISENYADSHWCLDELARICDSGRLVIPVFYNVDPSHVRKQLGPFKKGFDDLEKRFQDQKDKVQKWRDSMLKIGGIAGFVVKNNSDDVEHENLIRRLVRRLGTKRDDVIDILRGCGFTGEIAMTNLVEKCLIKIRQHDNTLWMHDQIRDMGRQIVLDENHVDPGMRSRLWDRAEIMSVLKSKKIPTMSRACDHIKDLNDKKEVWKLAVRIDDIWSNTKSSKEYAEMVIRDMKGDSIHVLFGPEEYKKRKDEFAALMKLKTCLMSNFRLQPNEDKFKLTHHPFKLHIISGTTIKPNDMPTMPDYFFKFMKFDDIKAMTFREDILVDVIGAVHEIGSAQTTATSGKLNISFRIKDLSGTVLDCILWESVASDFMEYCKNRIEEGPMILIIRRARLQKPTDRYPLQISNAWKGTKLIINEDIPDINEFKKSLPADNSYATQNKMMSFSSQRFASSVGGSQMTPEDNFIQNYRILRLSDIMRLPKDEICVTVVKTTCLKPSDRGWYMLRCKSCIRETKGTEPPYECGEGHKTADPILRFRIDVQVSDGDVNTKFVFWDNSCIDLLGVTASELQKQMLGDGVTDPLEYPKSIDEMMGRTFAFRVKWQFDWKACSVLECKDSKVLVSHIQKELNIEIPVDSAETCHSKKSVQADSSQPKEIEVQCSQSVQPQVLDSLDEAQVVSQDLYASADFDPLNQTNLTPSKRSAVKENIDDILSEQQSSTRLIKTRSTKRIKTEKP